MAACIWCSIDADQARARHARASKIAYYGSSFSPHLLEAVSLTLEDFRPIRQAMSDRHAERAARLVPPAMLRLGIAGDVDEVLEARARLIAAGARHISLGPPLGPDPEQAVATLGAKVLTALRAMQ